MESSSSDNGSKSCSWSSTTNWTIAGGSLDTSVSVDSSASPTDFEARAQSPLVLKPPSSDYCGSCEIKIHFTQKHKVRKVYVRSTAQVYEIYFSASLWSSDEYLFAVCCSTAATDDVVHPTDAKEPADAQSKGSTEELIKEKCIDDGKVISNEDDSGEVRLPVSSLQDNQNRSMPEKIDDNQGASIQAFYEATAENTEADACITLTLRLLSLQSKGGLCVDEIYVSTDLVELADSETQMCQEGNSAEVSTMDVISPMFLPLSKAGIKHRQDKHPSDATEGEVPKVSSRIAVSTDIGNEIKLEQSISGLQEVNKATDVRPQFQIPAHVSDTEQGHDSVTKTNVPYAHIETALQQLVSQVSRIEDICLSVEVNMLKPIRSIEARLQQIEQHVEMLTKNSQYSRLPCGTRISAPAFSCNGSDSSSSCTERCEYPVFGVFESEKEDAPCDKLSNLPDDMSVLVNDTRFLPCLVVTAPEFLCSDDEISPPVLSYVPMNLMD